MANELNSVGAVVEVALYQPKGHCPGAQSLKRNMLAQALALPEAEPRVVKVDGFPCHHKMESNLRYLAYAYH